MKEVNIGNDSFHAEPTLKYLGDSVGQCGGSDAVSTRIVSSWKEFRELLPIPTNRAIRPKLTGKVFNIYVRKFCLHGSETWPIVTEHVQRLFTADSGIKWICGVSLNRHIPATNLLLGLGVLVLSMTGRSKRIFFDLTDLLIC